MGILSVSVFKDTQAFACKVRVFRISLGFPMVQEGFLGFCLVHCESIGF